MHQILGLRQFTDSKTGKTRTYDAFFDKNWRVKNLNELYKDPQKFLKNIPESERYNLFYTVSSCKSQKREFKEFTHMAFDIDGGPDLTNWRHYLQIMVQTLNVPEETIAVVNSGNGLHFIVELMRAKNSEEWFKKERPYYKALCADLNFALAESELPGSFDHSIFEPRRILRMPGTINKKEGKEEKDCLVLKRNEAKNKVTLDLRELARLPDLKKGQALTLRQARKFGDPDAEAVTTGCEFIKWAHEFPSEVREPDFYAAASILGRLEDGENRCVELAGLITQSGSDTSVAHYSEDRIRIKVQAALETSGPRTCESIEKNSVGWDGCFECPWQGKCVTPLHIKGKDSIPTEKNGFHNMHVMQNGNVKLTPNVADLRRVFERDYKYRGYGDSGHTYVWNGKHYEFWRAKRLENFAHQHFNPEPEAKIMREFRDVVSGSNIEEVDWFTDSIQGKVNFNNGVLSLKTGLLTKHTPEEGFRYCLEFDYDEHAKCPNFDKMLERITCGDKNIEKVLLEFMGYAISGDKMWTHKALICLGDGANGKSTLMNILTHLAGPETYSALNLKQLTEEYGLALLDGKLFNLSEETPVHALKDSSNFKALASGSKVYARNPYGKGYFFKSTAKHIFLCNELPRSYDASHGFWRRFIVVPFDARFSDKDPDFDPFIEDKMKKELPGIFNRIYEAYKRLSSTRRFTHSDACDMLMDEYLEESNHALRFVTEATTPDRNEFVQAEALYNQFLDYAMDENLPRYEIPTRRRFIKQLRTQIPEFDRGYVKCKKQSDDRDRWGFKGFKLRKDQSNVAF